MYDLHVGLPSTTDGWEIQLHGYLREHEIPCVGVWMTSSLRFMSHRIKAGNTFLWTLLLNTQVWELAKIKHRLMQHHLPMFQRSCLGCQTKRDGAFAKALEHKLILSPLGLPFAKLKFPCISLVGHDGTFLDFYTSTSGHHQDSKLLRNTALYRNIATGGM